jgi:outer membrane protein OmpA-like peptidoglycan-associated protein
MKKRYTTGIVMLAGLLLMAIVDGNAQTEAVIFNEQIPVKIQRLRQMEDSVQLVMDIDLTNVNINTGRSLLLTPVLTMPQGREVKMKNILLNGRQRHKAFTREVALNGWEHQVKKAHYAVIPLTKENRKVYRYTQSVGFENWMREAKMNIETDLCGCAGYIQQIASEKVANRIVLEGAKEYRTLPNVAYIRPEVEQIKARSESSDVFLDFPVARTEINPGFGNNPRELAKIEQIMNEIRTDKNLTVTGVMITGYASPEGDVNFNNQLSRGRAEALRNYLSMRAGIPNHLYQVGFGGEDWEGLARLVQNSYIEPKNAVLSIINYNNNPVERKNRLKALNGGRVYQQLLHTLYPQLRRVVAKIDYNARNFNIEEAKQIIKTHPKQLSLNEMFLVANTYPEGSKEFMEVFEIAVKIFPDDPVANLNAAASALLTKDLSRAERYLQRADKSAPEYYNNLGVLSMMQGNNARAKNLFQRASESDIDAATRNLEELRKKEDADNQLKN